MIISDVPFSRPFSRPAEWKSVYRVVRRRPPPTTPPTLSEMVRMVAQLGGYVDRKRDDPPGPANHLAWPAAHALHSPLLATIRPGSQNRKCTCVEQRGRCPGLSYLSPSGWTPRRTMTDSSTQGGRFQHAHASVGMAPICSVTQHWLTAALG
jgi:hypothetical protein